MKSTVITIGIVWISSIGLFAQQGKEAVFESIEAKYDAYRQIAHRIWEYAEVGFQEENSSRLLQQTLRDAGFTIEANVAGMPTAFVASYGSGEPVVGIMGEYDALPGLAQAAVPEPQPIEGQIAGHACGHHLFGTASAAAAIAVKEWLEANGQAGTIRFYGTPAEEGGGGKVYMVRAGLFDDVDAMLHWHPGDQNSVSFGSTLSNVSGKFRFYGQASHAAGAPHRGRSALDAVEAMNYMVNLMREHVTEKTRIHYVITRGGEAPNVVPAFAEAYYYVRHPDPREVKSMWERVVKAAEGAALGTGTRMDYEITNGVYNILPNEILAKIMQQNLEMIGGYTYTDEERAFAEKIQASFSGEVPDLNSTAEVLPLARRDGSASTDVADVTWVVPTMGLRSATWVPGTSAHSWQAVAAGGMSIGHKGMMIAAKTMAGTMVDLFASPAYIEQAQDELAQRRGKDFRYEALLGDRPPALDYRK